MAKSTLTTGIKELIGKTFDLGLGAAYLTTEAAKKLVDELVAKGAVKKQEKGKLLEELLEKGKRQKEEVEKGISNLVDKALAGANLARRSDLEKLKKRVKDLEQRLQ